MKRCIVGFLLCTWTLLTLADDTVYKVISADGSVVYTDIPSKQAVPVTLPTGSVMVSKGVTKKPITPSSADKARKEINIKLLVTSPKPEQTIRDNNGQVTIQATLDPQVQGEYTLHLNDQRVSQNSGVFKLQQLDRGAYTFYIEFALKSGKILASTPKQTFYLHQASALNRPN
ncbi:hypothetical protein FX988_01696 [Paraglaciecola mesophila]|uniref:DUF4124 domain-containing protein n=1 Tax=Paraglaciecola mesophila TaxID=197222 RepID=A0A857JKH3_9ALTE|nr:DUF4124 domain-containing protein [Paraglaciecola mesophila]QHJ11467.1 hypothetical protein FX988_01696 [Paraglaciecola mesophila]